MSKSVMLSIQPKWCELIASGKKTIEVRKTKPKIDVPFKCYIYCTKAIRDANVLWGSKLRGGYYYCDDRSHNLSDEVLNGKVIGEFICDSILDIPSYVGSYEDCQDYDISDNDLAKTCLGQGDLFNYGRGKPLYGWHISNLKIYDEPRELKEFFREGKCDESYCETCEYFYKGQGRIDGNYYDKDCCELEDNIKLITRPPQSWQYVEEIE